MNRRTANASAARGRASSLAALARLFVLLLAWLLGPVAHAAATASVLEGRVTHVTDGDTLWFAPADGAPRIELRLLGIDAPEICQSGGAEAKAFLAELVARQTVHLRPAAGRVRDIHGRMLGTLYVGGVEVNRRMVEEGHAWSARYKWDRGPYVAQERAAIALRRGLHASAGAVAPQAFRKQHGSCVPAGASRAGSAPHTTVPPPAGARWHCDGRTRCHQMHSCEEATFFLRHCPGVQLDGNHDGVPCERQWCGASR